MTCCLCKFLWNFSFILLGILSDRWVQTEMFREGQFLLCVFCLPAWLVGCIAFVSVQWLAESLACFFLCVCVRMWLFALVCVCLCICASICVLITLCLRCHSHWGVYRRKNLGIVEQVFKSFWNFKPQAESPKLGEGSRSRVSHRSWF